MNLKKTTDKVSDLFTLRGSFAPLSGELTQDGCTYKTEQNGLSVSAVFTTHASGVTCRKDTVKNVSDHTVNIRSALSKFVFNGGEYEVYSQRSMWCGERYGDWQPLVTEVSASNDDIRYNTGAAPFFAIYNLQNHHGVAFHILGGGKWRFRVRKYFFQPGSTNTVNVELGLDDSDLCLDLAPGESLELPTILFYEFTEKNDMDAYKLHRYCNEVYPKRALPIIYNSWMSKFDNISYDILKEQLDLATDIGAEYFVIDAGWFGKPNEWFDMVGDWEECLDASMAGRMKEFADLVRSRGLKFGLWFEIERATFPSQAYINHPEYYLTEGNYAFVNFQREDARKYILDLLSDRIEKYGIEFIKFDFNAPLTYDSTGSSFAKFFKGYDSFIKELRRRFPTIYLENCASGGMRMSMAALDGFDSFWMSDDHSLYSQLEIFKNTVKRMPPNMLEKWLTVRSVENFEPVYGGGITEKILVSGDAGWGHIEAVKQDFLKAVAVGGPIGISCDLTKLSPKLFETIKNLVADYKKEREFWSATECRILCDTASLTILQFSDSSFEKIKLYAISNIASQNSVTVYPVADRQADYLCSDGTSVTAELLQSEGVDIAIPGRYTAKWIQLTKISNK